MSNEIVFPFDVPVSLKSSQCIIPLIKKWRIATRADIPNIQTLIRPGTQELFGDIDLEELLEYSSIKIVMENQMDQIIAFIALQSSPNVSSVFPKIWHQWIMNIYRFNQTDYGNTLFIHYLVWDPRYSWEFLGLIMKSLFLNNIRLHYIILVVPPYAPTHIYMGDNLLNEYFSKILPIGRKSFDSSQTMYICMRKSLIANFNVRRSVEEDNDDIVELIEKSNPLIRQLYGDFYISEMLVYNSDTRKIIAIENERDIFGFLSFNTEVDLDLIGRHFHTATFNYFRQHTASPEYQNKYPRISEAQNWLMYHIAPKEDILCEPDAFLIELYSMSETVDSRFATDLIIAAFDEFTKLSYCLITVPTSTRNFPLLRHFTRVNKKHHNDSNFPKTLYCLHRNSILGKIYIRYPEAKDEQSIYEFLQYMTGGKNLAEEIIRLQKNHNTYDKYEKKIFPFLIFNEKSIIGMVLITRCNDIQFLQLNFEIDMYINRKYQRHWEFAYIEYFILHPIFKPRITSILNDLFRMTDFTCFFYKLHEMNLKNANNIVTEMIPVKRRRRLAYKLEHLTPAQRPASWVLKDVPEFSLLFINQARCAIPRKIIDLKLVIFGCTRTALSFLENFIYNKQTEMMNFTNIILIDKNGLKNYSKEVQDFGKFCYYTPTYTSQYIDYLHFENWISVINADVMNIKRDEKKILVDNGTEIIYDKLLIFCNKKYTMPLNIKSLKQDPRNIVYLNKRLNILDFVNKMHIVRKKYIETKIIAYGGNIEIYSILNYLLFVEKIDPKFIIYIQPNTRTDIFTKNSIFKDEFVNETVQKFLIETKITIYSEYNVLNWKIDRKNKISQITLINSQYEELVINGPLIFICMGRICISPKIRRIIRRANIIYNEAILINRRFQTNDKSIYAIGSGTKCHEFTYEDLFCHEYLDPNEVGKHLAEEIISHINNERDNREELISFNSFTEPLLDYRVVLNNYYYMCVSPAGVSKNIEPSENADIDYISGVNDKDEEIDTKSCNDRFNFITLNMDNTGGIQYFRIQLDRFEKVSKIVCLSKNPIEVDKYKSLYGKHERILGKLRKNYENNLIPCFYSYFDNLWIYIIMHDRFENFMIYSESVILNEISDQEQNTEWNFLNDDEKFAVIEKYASEQFRPSIVWSFLTFIKQNIDQLPMFIPQNDVKLWNILYGHQFD